MVEDNGLRFHSVEAALSFYFRLEHLLSAKNSLKIHLEGPIRSTGADRREELMLDFATVGTCLKNLNPLQLWILRELYLPGRPGEKARRVSKVCAAGQRTWPRVRWTSQSVGRIRRQTIRQLEPIFAAKALIPQPERFTRGTKPYAREARYEPVKLHPSQRIKTITVESDEGRRAGAQQRATFRPRRRQEIVFTQN